ncbi:MAG: Kazal-type serine protease inhibitor family protein [Candidatus Thiodiazotropha sp.]
MAALTVLLTVTVCLISTVVSMDILQLEQRRRRAAPCSMDWKPVCGTNGVTYGNKCMMETK